MIDVFAQRNREIEVFPLLLWEEALQQGAEEKDRGIGRAEQLLRFELAQTHERRITDSEDESPEEKKDREQRTFKKK